MSGIGRHTDSQWSRFVSVLSFCSLLIIATAFYKGSDATSIMSTIPPWLWALVFGIPAVVAWIFAYSRIGLVVFIGWVVYGFVTMDSIPALARTGLARYRLPLQPGFQQCRIVSLDCEELKSLPIAHLARLNADVFFLQGLANTNQTYELAWTLFGNKAAACQVGSCAIICSDGELSRSMSIPSMEGVIADWIPQRSILPIRLVNVRFARNEGKMNFLLPSQWKYYSNLRSFHRMQMNSLLESMRIRGSRIGNLPVIMGGNFNASPHSSIFRQLDDSLIDVFREVGSGMGYTSASAFPAIRNVRLFVTSPLLPQQAEVRSIPEPAHSALICDVGRGK